MSPKHFLSDSRGLPSPFLCAFSLRNLHAGDKSAGGNNPSSVLLLESRECLRSSQCSLHTVKDPAGALVSAAYLTCYNLSLSKLILLISKEPSIPQCTDCGLKRWHRAVPTTSSALTDSANPSGRISRPAPFSHLSGTQSIQINAAEVDFCSHFSSLPSRVGMPCTMGKDFLPLAILVRGRSVSVEREGRNSGSGTWFPLFSCTG